MVNHPTPTCACWRGLVSVFGVAWPVARRGRRMRGKAEAQASAAAFGGAAARKNSWLHSCRLPWYCRPLSVLVQGALLSPLLVGQRDRQDFSEIHVVTE